MKKSTIFIIVSAAVASVVSTAVAIKNKPIPGPCSFELQDRAEEMKRSAK